MFFEKWIEIYCTLETSLCFSARNALYEANIKFKVDTINNELRLAMNNIRENNVALNRSGGIKNFYRISVKEKDVKRAKDILSKKALINTI